MIDLWKKKNADESVEKKSSEKKQERNINKNNDIFVNGDEVTDVIHVDEGKKACTPASIQNDETNVEDSQLSALEKREINRAKWKKISLDYDVKTDSKTKICAMKKIGIAHIRNELPCQDSFMLKQGKNYSIAVIADGHGSKKHDLSEFGSKIACESLIETVDNYLSKKQLNKLTVEELCSIKFKSSLVNQWKINVKKHFLSTYDEKFDEENTYVRYGTTLLFTIDYGDEFIVGQLGDGGILLSDGNGYYKKHREDNKIGSGTASLCSPNSYMLLSIASYSKKNICNIMMMTDGMYDIFGEDKPLYSNFDDFIEHFNNSDKDIHYFNEKYNSYVEYISDDTTVALIKCSPIKGKHITEVENVFTGEKYEIISENRTGAFCEYTINIKKNKLQMILGDFLPERKLQPYTAKSTKIQILPPKYYCKHPGQGDKTGLVYDIDAKFITIDEYFESIIKRKSTKSDIELFFKIASNLIDIIDELEEKDEYFDETMFRRMFRFDVDSGECVLLWYRENNRKHWQTNYQKHIQLIIMDFLFDFLFTSNCGNLNILDELEYTLVSDILKKNIIERIPENLSTMFMDVKKGKSIDFDEFKQEIILCLRRLVLCSNCKRHFIIGQETSKCPHCQADLISAGNLVIEDKTLSSYSLPIVTGVEYTSNNIGFGKFKNIITIVYSEHQKKFGIKNDSGISWTAYDASDAPFEVPTGKVKCLNNTQKIKIQDKTIIVKLKGDENNG